MNPTMWPLAEKQARQWRSSIRRWECRTMWFLMPWDARTSQEWLLLTQESSCSPQWGTDCVSSCWPSTWSWGTASAGHDATDWRDGEQYAQQKLKLPLEDDNDNYSEGIQDRGGKRPPMRPLGKADKPPAWKGSCVERWQECTVSLQAWYLHCQQGLHDRGTGYPQGI